jgi:hypothetical protein
MKKKLHIHIGTGKTGSSTIQSFLRKNQTVIYVNNGTCIADQEYQFNKNNFGNISTGYAYKLQETLEITDRCDFLNEKWEKLYQEMDDNGKSLAIISDESLADQAHFADYFAPATKYFKIRIIGYFRPQVDWIPSAWKQWHIKRGISLNDYIEECVKNNEPNYLSSFIGWESCFGKENIYIRPLVSSCLYEGSLLKDFSKAIGIYNNSLDFDIANSNSSLDPSIYRILAARPEVFEGVHDNKIYGLLNKVYDTTKPIKKESMLTPRQHRIIYDSFHDMNREIHQRYFSEFDFDLIFKSEQLKERNESSIVDDLAQVCAIQFKILQNLDSRLHCMHMELEYINKSINKITKGKIKRMAARFSNSIKKRIKVH